MHVPQYILFVLNPVRFLYALDLMLLISTEGSLGHGIIALEAVDKVISEDVEGLGEDMMLKVQDLMSREFEHKDHTILPEDEIQRLLMGANRVIDYALTLELQVIKLKQHTLRIINTAPISSACEGLLDLLQNTYGYRESLESHQEGICLATFPHPSTPTGPEIAEEQLTSTEEAQQAQELASALQIDIVLPGPSSEPTKCPAKPSGDEPAIKKPAVAAGQAMKQSGCGTWLKPISEVTPFHPISEGSIHTTSIDKKCQMSSSRVHNTTVYKCKLCGYPSEQHTQCATHIRGMHLSTCLAYHLCSWHTYHSIDFQKHLDKHHPSQESTWYPPLPDLSNIEIKKEVDESEIPEVMLEYNIDSIKAKTEVLTIPDDSD